MTRLLAGLFSWFNLRSLCAFSILALLLAPLSCGWLVQPDAFLFRIGVALSPKPDSPSQLLRVTVPAAEMKRLQQDVSSAVEVDRLVQGLQGVFTKGILLVVRREPDMQGYAADVLAPHLLAGNGVKDSLQAAGLLEETQAPAQRRDRLYTALKESSILLGKLQTDADERSEDAYAPESVLTSAVYARALLPASLVSYFFQAQGRFPSRSKPAVSGLLPEYPLQPCEAGKLAYPLLWRLDDSEIVDGVTSLLKKETGASQLTHDAGYLVMDAASWPVSASNAIYPMFGCGDSASDAIASVALSDLHNASDFNRFYNKTLVIGAENDPSVAGIASVYFSLEKKAYYTIPAWYPLFEKLLLLLLLPYLFVLLPRLQANTGMAVTLVLSLSLVVLQLGLQASQQWWLPVGLLLLVLFAGHICSLLWMRQQEYLAIQPDERLHTISTVPVKAGLIAAGRREEPKMPDSGFARTVVDKPASLRLGRYEVDGELGRGAMGVVYLGHDPSIDRKVAIKTLNYALYPKESLGELKERFFREAKAAGNLKHQNIVTIYEMAETADLAYIAMEYVGGKSLSAYTKKGQLLPVDEVCWIMIHVAEALGYAHEHQVVHRDIKPSNILYDRQREEVKVADFGIARLMDHTTTRTGDILGSPLYMSPEQIKGEKVTGASDIFSLGVTFYQLLTGELPFGGDTMAAITHQIVNGKYTSVTEINPELPESAQRIIARALQKNPEKRFASAYEVSDLLQKYLGKG